MSSETNSEYDDKPTQRVGDIKLACRAIRERWPMSDEAREGVVASLYDVIQNGKNASVKIKAARALATLDTINLKAEEEQPPPAPPQLHVHANLADADQLRTRLSAISARLGFNGVVVEGSAVDAAANPQGTGGT